MRGIQESEACFQILASNSLLMYCIHSGNTIAFEVLLERKELDLLWKNNTGANILQLLAKKGLLDLAQKCWKVVEKKSPEDRNAFLNNKSYNGKLKHLRAVMAFPHLFTS